jgi:hypothetical protein
MAPMRGFKAAAAGCKRFGAVETNYGRSRHTGGLAMRLLADFIFLILFAGLLMLWLVMWAALHIAGGAIHLLLIIALVSLIVHLFRWRRVA